MYGGSEFDGGASALFSGGGFMTQATQTPDSSFSKSRGSQCMIPLTVKQIHDSGDDKLVVDGVDVSSVRLLGLVKNKAERATDVKFDLDDGTGIIEVNRWTNESTDTEEMSIIQNGTYVTICAKLNKFQGKKQVVAFQVRPVVDFNAITLHYIECIHVHLENTRPKIQGSSSMGTETPTQNEVRGYQTPVSYKVSSYSASGASPADIHQMVFDVFHEPASLAREEGLHVNEVVQRLQRNFPIDKIKEAIDIHVSEGTIYSTVDDFHYKSAANG